MIRNVTGLVTLVKRELVRFLVVSSQTILPPLISSTLFLLIFGLSVGRNIDFTQHAVGYLEFIVPGLVTMSLISSAYENTSSSLFIARWHNHIQEVLLSPLSYLEMVLGLLAGGVARGIIVAVGVFTVALLFTPVEITHPLLLLYFMVSISVIFSAAGLIAALWADNFGMLSLWNVYVITPAVFLGGVFHPVEMMPESLRFLAQFNPMHYLVSGVRYACLGIEEASVSGSVFLSLALAILTFSFTVHLFRTGYKLRT